MDKEKWANKQRKLAEENKKAQARFKSKEVDANIKKLNHAVAVLKDQQNGYTWKPSKRVKLNHQSKNVDVAKFLEAVKIAREAKLKGLKSNKT